MSRAAIVSDRPPLTAEQQRLVEGYLARWRPVAVLRKVWPSWYEAAGRAGLDRGEIRSACLDAVVRSAQTFDPAAGASFATYVSACLRNKVTAAIRRTPARKAFARGRLLVSGDVGGADAADFWERAGLADRRAVSPPAAARLAELREIVRRVLRVLPQAYRGILELKWGLRDGVTRTLEETAGELGLTRERVRQIEERCFERVRIPLQLALGGDPGGVPVRPTRPVAGKGRRRAERGG